MVSTVNPEHPFTTRPVWKCAGLPVDFWDRRRHVLFSGVGSRMYLNLNSGFCRSAKQREVVGIFAKQRDISAVTPLTLIAALECLKHKKWKCCSRRSSYGFSSGFSSSLLVSTPADRCSHVKCELALMRTDLEASGASDTAPADLLTLRLQLRRQRTNEKSPFNGAVSFNNRSMQKGGANQFCGGRNQSPACRLPSKSHKMAPKMRHFNKWTDASIHCADKNGN